jgi:hypothetical protein
MPMWWNFQIYHPNIPFLQVTVMSAQRRLARDILPGSYSLADVVEFSDLPPKYTLFAGDSNVSSTAPGA